MSAAALLLLGLAGAAAPAPGSADFVYVSGEVDDFSPGGGGGSGGLLWTHELSRTLSSEAGAFAYSLVGTSWAYGRLGATITASRKAIVHVEANLGGGSRDGSHIDYRLFRGSLSLEVVERRAWAEVESQYIDFDASRGSVLKLGAAFAPRPALVGRIAYYVSAGGNLGARFWTGRVDLQRRRIGFFAGLSVGRSRPEVLRFFSGDTVLDSTEVYGGVRVPAGRHELTGYLDTVGIEGTRRTGLAVLVKLRL